MKVFLLISCRYLPRLSTIPLCQGMSWVPDLESLPTVMLLRSQLCYDGCSEKARQLFRKNIISSFLLKCSKCLLCLSFGVIHQKGEQWSSGILWPIESDMRSTRTTNWFSGTDLDQFEKRSVLSSNMSKLGLPWWRRLGQSVEGGGKRRVFRHRKLYHQRLLKPVHDWLMSVLRMLPMDARSPGRSSDRLEGERHVFSYDLKNAPTGASSSCYLSHVGGLWSSFASAVVNSALAMNAFVVPFVKRKFFTCQLYCRTTLGYYASWASLCTSHHIFGVVLRRTGNIRYAFDKYAVLGDDVVIADPEVGRVYEETLKDSC